MLLDGAVAAVAVWLLRQGEIAGHDRLLGWIVAGASGSAVLRLRVLDFGRGEDSRPVGVATVYEPVRSLIEQQIDARSAECQTEWINYKLLPVLERAQIDPHRLADFLIDYLKGLPRLDPDRLKRETAYIVQTRDGPQSDRIKREAIARHAISVGAFRLLQRFRELAEGTRDPVD